MKCQNPYQKKAGVWTPKKRPTPNTRRSKVTHTAMAPGHSPGKTAVHVPTSSSSIVLQ